MAKGRFAYKAMITVPKTATAMVAVMDAPAGMPAARKIAGFTTTM